jgi:hypothetical protein
MRDGTKASTRTTKLAASKLAASKLAALVTVAALSITASSAVARAAPPAPATDAASARAARERDARITDLKKAGDAALDTKHYAEALAAYDEAYGIAPTAALLYNRGRALQFLGRFPEALDAIEAFARDAPPELRDRVPGLPRLLEELRGRVGSLVVTTPVGGARVLVNDKQVGITPMASPIGIAAGHLSIEVFAEGYFPMRREVDLPGKETRAVDFPLVSRDTSGLLVVRSHVAATHIRVDDRLLGLAPVEAGLVAGAHRIVAESDGYDDASTQVVLGAGEKREAWLDPTGRPAFYARWWFWTAVGVVVAGGVVTYVALTTDRATPSGSYSPGIVRF